VTDFPPPRPDRPPLVPPGGIDPHARDMTATFAADVTLRAAQARLGDLDQWLPIDGDPDAPLGALVDHNSTGPLRLGYGAWRDLLLGVQFANGRGELITAGGRTVKNVAGYDLTKFMVGGRGCFGRLVTLTTRTYRRPGGSIMARFAPDVETVGRLLPTALRPQWAVLTPDALWCGYLGDGDAIAYYWMNLYKAKPQDVSFRPLDEDITHRRALWQTGGAGSFRASVPPTRVPDFVRGAGLEQWAADPAFGMVVAPLPPGVDPDTIRSAAAALGGTVILPRSGRTEGPPSTVGATPLSSPVDVSTNPVERRIIDRLKQAFDPDHRLTPLPWHNR